MPTLVLHNVGTGDETTLEGGSLLIGRHPDCDLNPAGEGQGVVSGRHLEIRNDDGTWVVKDLGSSNGTYLGDDRIEAGQDYPLQNGMILGLGTSGPRLSVKIAAPAVEATIVEGLQGIPDPGDATVPMDAIDDTAAPAPPEQVTPQSSADAVDSDPPKMTLRLRQQDSGAEFTARGSRIRIGRGSECEIRLKDDVHSSVSRVHSEINLKPDGRCVLLDSRSRNGTLVNGSELRGERQLEMGDTLQLGSLGPKLVLTELTVTGVEKLPEKPAETPASEVPVAAADPPPMEGAASSPEPRRSFGGKGRTMFIKDLVQETEKKSADRVRTLVWSFVFLLVVSVGGVYAFLEMRTQRAVAAINEERIALAAQSDSLTREAANEREALRNQLAEASRNAAPTAMLDSLRQELAAANQRTEDLAVSLERAQSALSQQLAAADRSRLQAQGELDRLRREMEQASREQLDSLSRAVREAEDRVNDIESRARAVRGVDLAAVSQANQGAVGLVTTYLGRSVFDGSGFMISPDGYFVTNRHVVQDEGGRTADSVFITMADQKNMVRASIVNVAARRGPDLAILRVENYGGPHIESVDWTGQRARQGEPAALIGFPRGAGLAFDSSFTIRTSMSAGIFSKVTDSEIQFDGFTVGGSSGSPIFNADGEVVAVHHSGLRDTPGLGIAVPVRAVLTLLPEAVGRRIQGR